MHLLTPIYLGLALAGALLTSHANPASSESLRSGRSMGAGSREWMTEVGCGWCYNRASSPTGPYEDHYFGSGGEEENEDASDNAVAHTDAFDLGEPARLFGPLTAASLSDFAATATAPLALAQPAIDGFRFDVGDYMDCVAFNACHGNVQAGQCYQWHVGCGGSEDLVAELDRARREASWERFSGLATAGFSAVRVVQDRGVIQIVDCRGQIIAQERLPARIVGLGRRHGRA